jgi:hypothetical protein
LEMCYSEPQDPDPNFLEMLDPDPAPPIMNTDPQPWWQVQKTCPRDRYLSYCSLQTYKLDQKVWYQLGLGFSDKKIIPRKTELTEQMVISDGIPVVPRKRKSRNSVPNPSAEEKTTRNSVP